MRVRYLGTHDMFHSFTLFKLHLLISRVSRKVMVRCGVDVWEHKFFWEQNRARTLPNTHVLTLFTPFLPSTIISYTTRLKTRSHTTDCITYTRSRPPLLLHKLTRLPSLLPITFPTTSHTHTAHHVHLRHQRGLRSWLSSTTRLRHRGIMGGNHGRINDGRRGPATPCASF